MNESTKLLGPFPSQDNACVLMSQFQIIVNAHNLA